MLPCRHFVLSSVQQYRDAGSRADLAVVGKAQRPKLITMPSFL